MEKFNLKEFKDILKGIAKTVYLSACSEVDIKDICGFSLYSDGDGSSISASYNTFDRLEKNAKDDPDTDQRYYKWYPGEWKVDFIESEELDKLSDAIYHFSSTDTMDVEENFIAFKKGIYSSIVASLKELRDEGLFNGTPDEFILVFYITDYSNVDKEISWIQELNNQEKVEEFKSWKTKDN